MNKLFAILIAAGVLTASQVMASGFGDMMKKAGEDIDTAVSDVEHKADETKAKQAAKEKEMAAKKAAKEDEMNAKKAKKEKAMKDAKDSMKNLKGAYMD